MSARCSPLCHTMVPLLEKGTVPNEYSVDVINRTEPNRMNFVTGSVSVLSNCSKPNSITTFRRFQITVIDQICLTYIRYISLDKYAFVLF